MAFNPYLPISYQPNYFTQPAYQNPMQQPVQQQMQQPAAPQFTMPTIHADIIQANSMDEIRQASVGAGTSQMFMLKDESAIIIKSAQANGYTLDIYDKRPPEPPKPAFDPSAYVTRDELESRLMAILTPKRAKKEVTVDEPV